MRTLASLFLVSLIAASCSSSTLAPQGPSPGVLSGVVLVHASQGDGRTPLEDALVGVYDRAVSSGGPLLQNPPEPVATTTTDGNGVFRFKGLPAGRWFVLAIDRAGEGAWVRFDPTVGATVTLEVCSDCPLPL